MHVLNQCFWLLPLSHAHRGHTPAQPHTPSTPSSHTCHWHTRSLPSMLTHTQLFLPARVHAHGSHANHNTSPTHTRTPIRPHTGMLLLHSCSTSPQWHGTHWVLPCTAYTVCDDGHTQFKLCVCTRCPRCVVKATRSAAWFRHRDSNPGRSGEGRVS